MGPTLTSLISIDPLPKPILWAVPSPVVPEGEDITLRCQGHLGSDRFQLWKDGELGDERNASWQQAEFVLRNVDDSRNARSYTCRSGQGPLWSELSEPLALVVTGSTVTIWCKISQPATSNDYSFALLEAKSLEPLQRQSPAVTQAAFSLVSVTAEDTGSYSCIYYRKTAPYTGSYPSKTLELIVLGSLPKPSLSALPGLVVEPGMHVTLQCRQPPQNVINGLTYTLLKVGTSEPLQSQSPSGTSADFPLFSVRAQDAGRYSCVYHERMAPYQVSEASEVLEIWVTDGLPKPSLSAWPFPEVASGSDVTFLCQGPARGIRFVLYKEGDEKNLPSMDTSQGGAQFFLTHVTPKHSGNYSCRYQINSNGSLWTQQSDPLQLIVKGSVPSNSLLITLSCLSFIIILLLCLFLLAILCQRSITVDECGKDRVKPLRVYRSVQVETKGTIGELAPSCRPPVPMVEGSQGVTYTQLNIRTLNKRKTNPEETRTEPTLYATVALN
ncbi:immunoglobulin superfamily member 1-like [Trichosurus vulpecula]|uniref:immunoglobulin superfamily member 1-like n=1 Tax=Trichosurus vulpecula TaxID=9337 RepID=UPI00186AC94B|nr:immunoglobulin superfamily member 1-like [Trichosurus vulpecula]